MSIRWTYALLLVVLASTTCVLAQTTVAGAGASPSASATSKQSPAVPVVVTAAVAPPPPPSPSPAAMTVTVPVPPVTSTVTVPSTSSDNAAPHVQAVNVAKMYTDDFDEDEDGDDDFPPVTPSPPQPSKPKVVPSSSSSSFKSPSLSSSSSSSSSSKSPIKLNKGARARPRSVVPRGIASQRSIDERIAAQKFKIQQLKELLRKQRAKHVATAQLIAQRNQEIQERMKKHAAEMAKASDIQRRRDALVRAERAEKAREAAAKRAAEIRAQQRVLQLQKQLAEQHRAAAQAEQALARQQREDAIRHRVMSSQHATYQQLRAELKAHEAEWANRKNGRNKLKALKQTIKTPSEPVKRKSSIIKRRPINRRVTVTPKLSTNPFTPTTPNPLWVPRRRLLTPRIRRWLVVRIIRTRRAQRKPKQLPSITVARRRYQQARIKARNTLRRIIQKRTCKRSEARRSFRQLSRDLAITATLAQQALIRAKSRGREIRYSIRDVPSRTNRRRINDRRRGSIIRRRPINDRRRSSINRRLRRGRFGSRRSQRDRFSSRRSRRRSSRRPSRRVSSTIAFKLNENPYPKLVSTRDATSSAPRGTKLTELEQAITNTNENKEQ